MKIILVNPPSLQAIDSSLPKVLQDEEDPMPPLGLLYVASYLQKNRPNHQIKIIDCTAERLNHAQLNERATIEKPDLIGMTAMTFTMPAVIEACRAIKKALPTTKIVIGGPHGYIYPTETLNLGSIDFVILGEGEEAFVELTDKFFDSELYGSIKNLAYKKDNKVIINEFREPIADLDSLPFPDRRLVPYHKYSSAISEGFPITTMFTSRGCPFRCIFCNRPHLGKKFRYRSAENVVQEMEECYNLGIKEIFIYDDTFTVIRERVVDICNRLIEKKLDLLWDIRARVDTVDPELLKLLKKAGCVRIHFGVEAGTQKVINNLRKGITLEQVEKAFSEARKNDIKTLAYFMIGSPGETKEDILETIKFAKKIDPDFAHFTITSPYPATELYELGLYNKLIPRDYWKDFAENPTVNFQPMIWQENFTKEELMKLLEKAYSAFYWRPKYILRTLRNIKSFRELFKKTIAAFKVLKI